MMQKTHQALDDIGHWLLRSAADPNAVSMTLKGIASYIVPIVIVLSGATHLDIGNDQITAVVDSVIQLVVAILAVVSTGVTAFGMVRKLFWPTT